MSPPVPYLLDPPPLLTLLIDPLPVPPLLITLDHKCPLRRPLLHKPFINLILIRVLTLILNRLMWRRFIGLVIQRTHVEYSPLEVLDRRVPP
jgi:hypothetical protein